MFHQLGINHSLYHIETDHINQFKNLAAKWQTLFLNVQSKCMCELDSWAVILNSWLFLKSLEKDSSFLNSSKCLYYSTNTFLKEELLKFRVIHKIIAMSDDDLSYFAAFQLGNTLEAP